MNYSFACQQWFSVLYWLRQTCLEDSEIWQRIKDNSTCYCFLIIGTERNKQNSMSSWICVNCSCNFAIWIWYFAIFKPLHVKQKYLYCQNQCSKIWDRNVWPREIKWIEHSAWIQKLRVRVLLGSRHFLFQKLRHFHKKLHSCVKSECCCQHTVGISNVNFTNKKI